MADRATATEAQSALDYVLCGESFLDSVEVRVRVDPPVFDLRPEGSADRDEDHVVTVELTPRDARRLATLIDDGH